MELVGLPRSHEIERSTYTKHYMTVTREHTSRYDFVRSLMLSSSTASVWKDHGKLTNASPASLNTMGSPTQCRISQNRLLGLYSMDNECIPMQRRAVHFNSQSACSRCPFGVMA